MIFPVVMGISGQVLFSLSVSVRANSSHTVSRTAEAAHMVPRKEIDFSAEVRRGTSFKTLSQKVL